MDGWLDGWTARLIAGWMDGWMDAINQVAGAIVEQWIDGVWSDGWWRAEQDVGCIRRQRLMTAEGVGC